MKRLAVIALLLAAGCGGDGGRSDAEAPSPTPTAVELPGGGREILPGRRVVAFYGSPDDPALGTLGIGSPAAAGGRLRKVAEAYARPDRPVLPAFELIATIATFDPGPDGQYRRRARGAVIDRYLAAAREMDALLILDIQPGRAGFLEEARRLERWLLEPDVSLALDPEWHVTDAEVPGQVIGSVDAEEVVIVSAYLDALVRRAGLPQKLLVVHQFTEGMIRGRERLRDYPNVALVLNADGFGTPEAKRAKYDQLSGRTAFGFDGFKLFYEEDVDLMSPKAVLGLRPAPDLVVYE